jgi:hypothetical protein
MVCLEDILLSEKIRCLWKALSKSTTESEKPPFCLDLFTQMRGESNWS